MDLSSRQTIIIAIVVLFLGKYLNRRIAWLRTYNISEPVTGGILTSLLLALAYFVFDFSVQFESTARDDLLLMFFTTIG